MRQGTAVKTRCCDPGGRRAGGVPAPGGAIFSSGFFCRRIGRRIRGRPDVSGWLPGRGRSAHVRARSRRRARACLRGKGIFAARPGRVPAPGGATFSSGFFCRRIGRRIRGRPDVSGWLPGRGRSAHVRARSRRRARACLRGKGIFAARPGRAPPRDPERPRSRVPIFCIDSDIII